MKRTHANAEGRFVLTLFCNNCDVAIERCDGCSKKFDERDFVCCVGGTKYGRKGEAHICLDCYKRGWII